MAPLHIAPLYLVYIIFRRFTLGPNIYILVSRLHDAVSQNTQVRRSYRQFYAKNKNYFNRVFKYYNVKFLAILLLDIIESRIN